MSGANIGEVMPRHGACAVWDLAERSDVRLINGCIEDASNESRPQDKFFFGINETPTHKGQGSRCTAV